MKNLLKIVGLAVLLLLLLSACGDKSKRPEWAAAYEEHMSGVSVLGIKLSFSNQDNDSEDGFAPIFEILTESSPLGQGLKVLGLEQVSGNENQLDLSVPFNYSPTLLAFLSEDFDEKGLQKQMEKLFREQPNYWASIDAIQYGKVIYLPSKFSDASYLQDEDALYELSDLIHDKIHPHH